MKCLLQSTGSAWQLVQMSALQASAAKQGAAHLGAELWDQPFNLTLTFRNILNSLGVLILFIVGSRGYQVKKKKVDIFRWKSLQQARRSCFVWHECSFHRELTPNLEKTCLCGCWIRAKSDTGSTLLPQGISTFLILDKCSFGHYKFPFKSISQKEVRENMTDK